MGKYNASPGKASQIRLKTSNINGNKYMYIFTYWQNNITNKEYMENKNDKLEGTEKNNKCTTVT